MKTPKWSLRRRVSALMAVVSVLLLALAAGAAMVATDNRHHLNTLIDKTGPLRTGGEALLAALVNQETGIRGYAVTGEPADLNPYNQGLAEEKRLVAAMNRLLDDEPKIRAELQAVEQQAEQWRNSVAIPVIQATAGGGRTAGQALLTEQTRMQFDALRAATNSLQSSILDLRDEVSRQAQRTGNELVILLLIAALVVLVAGFVLLTSLNRLVIGPVTALAAQVREVAGGDYQRRIEDVGPPELARLAGDVDGMRRKIAADLDEVQDSRTRVEWVNSQLQKQAEELVRSNRDLEQFAYVASHDLQEPLRKVASFCQLLQRRYAGKLDERADQYIAFAVDGAQRMQRLINDLLAFSRIGRLTSGFGDVDLNELMGNVASQTESAREYAGGTLTWSELPVIRGEEPLLTNLLANLVSNSLKFRRPDVPPEVRISARQVGDEWEITCEDNGIGIEPEFADKIFVIFQRLHSKDAYPGTGIGLAIAKKIVEYHGGRIWIDLDRSEGTAIRFTLPLTPELPGEQPQPALEAANATTEAANATTGEPDPAPGDVARVGGDAGRGAGG